MTSKTPEVAAAPRTPKQIDPRIRDGLWSLYFHAQHLSPAFVPPNLRPAPLGPSIREMLQVVDEHRVIRAHNAALQLFRAARAEAPREFVNIARYREPAVDIVNSAEGRLKDAIEGSDVPIDSSDAIAPFPVMREYYRNLTAMAPFMRSPCAYPAASSTYHPDVKQTTISGSVTVTRPLDDDLASLLDPQRWSECSDLFKSTYRVVDIGGFEYPPLDPAAPNAKGWAGLLYEQAEAGWQTVENILKIDYSVRKKNCKIDEVVVQYRLYASLSYRLAGLDLPGVLRENRGVFRAKPTDKKVDGRDDWTKVYCEKTLNFARLTRWSGFGLFDYGEILNYIAPAIFCLWLDDLQQVVPCCPEPPSTRQGEKRKGR